MWPKYWSFSFSVSPSNEYSALISFRIDWFDLLAVQGTLKSLLQHYSSKASILWHSAFFMVQLSHPYMTTRQTFVGKVTSLLFNMLSSLVVTVLPRSKCLLISWSPSAVILEPKKNFHCSSIYLLSISHFFLVLSHIPLSGCPELIEYSHNERHLVCFQMLTYVWSCYGHLSASFLVDISFQLLWENTKECDCWIVW